MKKTEQEIELINDLYYEYGTVKAVCIETGFKWDTVAKYIKSPRNGRRKYQYNDGAFEQINNVDTAYWFGFFCADGCVDDSKGYPCRSFFYLKPGDIAHCNKFISFINGHNEQIKVRKDGYVGVEVGSKEFATNLVNLGCTPRKSLTLSFPTQDVLPDRLMRDFIRGYFDGDGSIHIRKRNSSPVCSIVGTPQFISSLQLVLNRDIGLRINSIYMISETTCEIKYEGNPARRLMDYMYCDCNTYLNRKFNKYALMLSN